MSKLRFSRHHKGFCCCCWLDDCCCKEQSLLLFKLFKCCIFSLFCWDCVASLGCSVVFVVIVVAAVEEEELVVAAVVAAVTLASGATAATEVSLSVHATDEPLLFEVVLFKSLEFEKITAPSASTVTFSWTWNK